MASHALADVQFVETEAEHGIERPLRGVRIVESGNGMGAFCARVLCDLGAEVLLVEAPEALRHEDRAGAGFRTENAGKRSVILDLDADEDRANFLGLLGTADLWIDRRAPASLEGGVLDPAVIRTQFPGLVVLSITPFGLTGPLRSFAATEAVLMAMAGILSRSGSRGRPPLMPPGNIATRSGSVQAAWCAMLGLWNRFESGVGDHLDFSLHDGILQILDPPLGAIGSAAAGAAGVCEDRSDFQPYPIFRCADGHVRVVLLAVKQWRALREWLGEPSELRDPELDRVDRRMAQLDLIYPVLAKFFGTKAAMDLVDEGQRRGVPIAPVLDPGQVMQAEHFLARGALKDAEVEGDHWIKVPDGLLQLNGWRLGPEGGAPTPGDGQDRLKPVAAPAVAPPTPSGRRRTFAGLRVLDLGVIVMGAEAGRLFSDQGADVIKVENRAYPDGSRAALTRPMTSRFAAAQRGKRSFGVELRSEQGREYLLRLAEHADVVLSNFKPGTLEALGIGVEELRRRNPRLVVATSSAMGSTGPWSSWMGYGPLVRSACGLTDVWRYGDDPNGFGDSLTVFPDHLAARIVDIAVVAALIARRRTAEGAHLDVAQAEVILGTLAELYIDAQLGPRPGPVGGNREPKHAPSGLFPCMGEDEWCVIDVQDNEAWTRLVEVAGLHQLADPRYAVATARADAEDEITQAISTWTKRCSAGELELLLQGIGVPAGRMRHVTDFSTDYRLTSRRVFVRASHPLLKHPFTMENAPCLSTFIADPTFDPAPLHGEHTMEIARELLGLAEEELRDAVAAGFLQVPDPSI